MTLDVTDLTLDPTTESLEGFTNREVRLCSGCGLPESRWRELSGSGYASDDGHVYCCRGCADETGCTCVQS